MTGRAVVTTRLSSATMNSASELMMKAQAGLDRVSGHDAWAPS